MSVFISHISEEKEVALKLQALIRTVFGNAFPVFVSSDPMSLGGGKEWYHHILRNLAEARIVLILLSPDSADREWINFEAGFGQGRGSQVIPIASRGLSFDGLNYPLKGLQGYYFQQRTDILNEISKGMGVDIDTTKVDVAAAWEEINEIQIELPARKLALEMESAPGHQKLRCYFHLVNNGNRDVEPTEVTVWVPSAILHSQLNFVADRAILEVLPTSIDGVEYTGIAYRNYLEPTIQNRFSNPEPLVNRVTPGVKVKLQHPSFEVRFPLQEHEIANPIRYKIACKNMKALVRTITLKDKLVVPKS